MKGIGSFFTSTAMAGLLVLLPLAILFIVVVEIWELLESVSVVAELELPFPPVVNALIFLGLGALAVFVICLLTGLLLKTGPGQRFSVFVEKSVAEKVPLLGLIRNLTLSISGRGSTLKPVEADVNGSGAPMLGFLMETLNDGRHVIFIPSAPAVTLGSTYIVPDERVRILDASVASVVNAITQWGVGAKEIYASGTALDDTSSQKSTPPG